MSDTTELLIEKLKDLPPNRLAEVDDFVDFLKLREEKKARAGKGDELFAMMATLSSVEPILAPEEIQAEIDAARAERRAGLDANRR